MKPTTRRVAQGLGLVGLIVLAIWVANDDRIEVERLSREICGTYLDGGNYFAIALIDLAWLAACVALAVGAWGALYAAERARARRRGRAAWCWVALAAMLVAGVFAGSELVVNWFTTYFVGACPRGSA